MCAFQTSHSNSIDSFFRYDIQEEKGRMIIDRPFPFSATHDPRKYAILIRKHLDLEIILYCAVSDRPRDGFEDWLRETYKEGIRTIVLVGRSSQSIEAPGYTVLEAAKLIKEIEPNFILGGITIPGTKQRKCTNKGGLFG